MLLLAGLYACENKEEDKDKDLLCKVEISEISATSTSVLITGKITFEGKPVFFERGFCYSTSSNLTVEHNKVSVMGSGIGSTGSFAADIKELNKNTTYYVKAYAINDAGVAYSEEREFTTENINLGNGLAAYYSFNEQNCTESQGKSQFNGIIMDSEPVEFSTDIPGNTGYSARFNGNSYFKTIQSPTYELLKNNFSISLWIKTMSTNTSFIQTYQIFGGFLLGFRNGLVCYQYSHGDNRYYCFSYSGGDFLYNGNWHLITVVVLYDETSDPTLNLFLDGNLYASRKTNIGDRTYMQDIFLVGIGYTGLMDNLRIYNRELTPLEVKELYDTKQ